MNLEKLKSGFINYLEHLKTTDSSGKYENIDYANVSIFSYQDEFKEYIGDEYTTANSIQSMSINDILDMEVVDGKLVTEEELAEMEQATEAANNGENPEGEPKGEPEGTDGEKTNVVTGVIEEMMQNEDFIQQYDADGDKTINTEELNGFLTLANNIDGDSENLSVDDLLSGMSAVTNKDGKGTEELLDKVKENENFVEALDSDGDKKLSDDELNGFLHIIDCLDGILGNVSVDDLLNGVNSLLNGEQLSELLEGVKDTPYTTAIENSQGNSGSTAGSPVVSNAGSTPKQNTAPTEKSLEQMSESELKTELGKANDSLTKEQDALAEIKNGSNPELQNLQENTDKAYEEYQNQLKEVDEELAKQVDDLKTQIDAKDNEISQQENAISQQKSAIANAESAYSNAQSTTQSLEGRLGELKSQETAEKDPTKKAAITAKRTALEAEIANAKKAEETAKQELETQKESLIPLEDTLTTLEAEKADLETQMQDKEAEVREKYPEVAKSLDAYKEAEKAYDEKEQSLTTEAQSKIDEAQAYVKEVEKTLNDKQTETKLKEYNTNQYDAEAGQFIVDCAYDMLDEYGSSRGYCATGVSRTIEDAYGIKMRGNGCDWDSNMDALANQGYFVEATADYASASDLSSLPAGAVVCWENTGGTNGGGAQYGHVTVADGKGGEISDHHANKIYTKIGGSSTNYKVYLPVKKPPMMD